MKQINVLIVDDSELIRQLLTEILSSTPDLNVVGTAADPYEAREKIKQLNPDVLTLDVEMPKMDGISFLKNLMRLRPMPVVMISTLTAKGAPVTLDALEIGAVDYICKPQAGSWDGLNQYAELIQTKVRNAAGANLSGINTTTSKSPATSSAQVNYNSARLICLGSSTGGTEALKEVLLHMPPNCPPIVMAQHIPPAFSGTFAARLNTLSAINVYEAKAGMPLKQGCAYLAPGDRHLKVCRRNGVLTTVLFDGDKVNGHIPSVDVLFDSAVEHAGKHCVGAVLTGMGVDGAQGLKNIRTVKGHTIAQDESTSVVWGMPGAAVRLGAATEVLPLGKVGPAILKACQLS